MIMLETLKVISAAIIGGALGGLIGYVSMYKAWRLDKEDFFDKGGKEPTRGMPGHRNPPPSPQGRGTGFNRPTVDNTTTPPTRPTEHAANAASSEWLHAYHPPKETGAYRVIIRNGSKSSGQVFKTIYLGYSALTGWELPDGGELAVWLWQPLD